MRNTKDVVRLAVTLLAGALLVAGTQALTSDAATAAGGGVVSNYGLGIEGPESMTTGPDGALWFINSYNDTIGRITTAGVVTNYTDSSIQAPGAITPGPDGALWFTNRGGWPQRHRFDREDHDRRGGHQLHRSKHHWAR